MFVGTKPVYVIPLVIDPMFPMPLVCYAHSFAQ
ncbi:hypothetical protein VSPL_43510 [Vibrio splendidus]|nr:hypothetical protein VSPL_43510 [Vibrio splendidus]